MEKAASHAVVGTEVTNNAIASTLQMERLETGDFKCPAFNRETERFKYKEEEQREETSVSGRWAAGRFERSHPLHLHSRLTGGCDHPHAKSHPGDGAPGAACVPGQLSDAPGCIRLPLPRHDRTSRT